ncbi:MAG: nickel-dependent lactate racemase [Thermodesulfobacteriota bacterium]|nr:nickel-dependent lactate racemase [Thermodesulfobacteriota bacterium]
MLVNLPYNNRHIEIRVPDDAAVYRTSYREPETDARELVLKAVRNPAECPPLSRMLRTSGAQSVVLVVSDMTRPIPYADFLDTVLEEIEDAAVPGDNILILIATGMHRPTTAAEREHMFGPEVCERYRIIDHHAEKSDELVTINGTSHTGRPIELNRYFVEADFRIVTGLVEPHFMAGFSGGRKAVCPGLCSLETVKAFHSFTFLNHPSARNGNLEGNPLHHEALSIARQAKVGFCINLVVDRKHRLVDAVAGDLEASHEITCKLVSQHACPPVEQEKDVVLTSSGGYPLDATFYQCVKGMNSCMPTVRKGGVVVSIGSCSEGIGGTDYKNIMYEYSGRWREFLRHLQSNDNTMKDQWEFQMQTKVLEHVGDDNLIFVTDGLSTLDLNRLSVNGIHASEGHIQERVQELLDGFIHEGRSLSVIPEGPYCAPIK